MNSSYEVTTSEVDASYYRTVDFLPGGGARVIVYYLQGKVKMEGSYFDNSLKTEHGKFLIFTGTDSQNLKENSTLVKNVEFGNASIMTEVHVQIGYTQTLLLLLKKDALKSLPSIRRL